MKHFLSVVSIIIGMADAKRYEVSFQLPESNEADMCMRPVPTKPLKSIPDKFFSELTELAKTLDHEVSILESKAHKAVSRASYNLKGEFSAPIADDLNDELLELSRMLDDKLKYVNDHSETMDSFIDQCLQTFEENRKEVMKIQEYAAQYGYEVREESKPKSLDRDTLCAEVEALEKSNEMTLNESIMKEPNDISKTPLHSHSGSMPNTDLKEASIHKRLLNGHLNTSEVLIPQTDTPKLLQIGLSKDTLKQMGFTFKEDAGRLKESMMTTSTKPNASQVKPNVQSTSGKVAGKLSAKMKEDEKCKSHESSQAVKVNEANCLSNNDSPLMSILKSTRITDNPQNESCNYQKHSEYREESQCSVTDLTVDDSNIATNVSVCQGPTRNVPNTSIDISRVEISPGLIVKRPSSKRRCDKLKYDNASFPDDNKITCIPIDSESGDEILAPDQLEEMNSNVNVDESPRMPSLKTIDVQKFLKDLNDAKQVNNEVCADPIVAEHHSENSVSKNEVNSLSQTVESEELTKIPSPPEPDTPEMPVLKTINLAKYLSNCNSMPSIRDKSNDMEDSSQDTNVKIKAIDIENSENKTPEIPELATISPRRLIGNRPSLISPNETRADSLLGKQRSNETPEKDLSVLKNGKKIIDESPVCPLLSESSMKLLNKYK